MAIEGREKLVKTPSLSPGRVWNNASGAGRNISQVIHSHRALRSRTCQRLRTGDFRLKKKGYETVKFNIPKVGILA
jgi:hypothetical protein